MAAQIMTGTWLLVLGVTGATASAQSLATGVERGSQYVSFLGGGDSGNEDYAPVAASGEARGVLWDRDGRSLVSIRPPGSEQWGGPVRLSSPTFPGLVGVDDTGNAYVVGQHGRDGGGRHRLAIVTPDSVVTHEQIPAGVRPGRRTPIAALATDGRLVVAGNDGTIASRDADGTWSPTVVPGDLGGCEPKLARAVAHTAAVLWQCPRVALRLSTFNTSTGWASPVELARLSPSSTSVWHSMVVLPAGEVRVAWAVVTKPSPKAVAFGIASVAGGRLVKHSSRATRSSSALRNATDDQGEGFSVISAGTGQGAFVWQRQDGYGAADPGIRVLPFTKVAAFGEIERSRVVYPLDVRLLSVEWVTMTRAGDLVIAALQNQARARYALVRSAGGRWRAPALLDHYPRWAQGRSSDSTPLALFPSSSLGDSEWISLSQDESVVGGRQRSQFALDAHSLSLAQRPLPVRLRVPRVTATIGQLLARRSRLTVPCRLALPGRCDVGEVESVTVTRGFDGDWCLEQQLGAYAPNRGANRPLGRITRAVLLVSAPPWDRGCPGGWKRFRSDLRRADSALRLRVKVYASGAEPGTAIETESTTVTLRP